MHIETEEFYKDIAKDINKLFDRSNYDKNDNRPLPIGINKKVIGMFKDELRGKITVEFCGPRAKTYAYLIDKDSKNKKTKGTNKCVTKRRLKFKDYKDSVFENKTILRSQLRFKSDHHNVSTEEVNKTTISMMMMRDCKHLIKLQQFHMEQMHLKLAKAK